MPDEPLIYPGDVMRDEPIQRRSEDDTKRELGVNRQQEPPPDPVPGGAEGGDESNSADWLVDHPRDTDPLGDTDQHSDAEKVPPRPGRESQDRGG